ncbi:hypothetical protein MRB53_035758 [Persea americana]|uniref:Uncharacterized protein n=1 Tax=Persea americana TaxID=3435 RepID=A0ACC2K5T6_PERAE|nr:hypothetical protein MRB53_035758 [Persea americana]
MEKTDSERRIVERREEKRKENGGHVVYHPVISAVERCPGTDVKLAAIAVGLNIRLKAADMPAGMQERAFRYARLLLDAAATDTRPNPTHIALALKKEFDSSYGPAWHCVVGKSFGSFLTHSPGGFLYFSVDKLSFLLFKTVVQPII